jgi:protease inhibitor Inh
MHHVFVVGLALLATWSGTALAQPASPGDSAKAMAGTWEFTNADRDKTCTITLRLEPVAGGMRAEFDKACAGKFPFIGEIAAWTFAENDFLRLVDAKGAPVLEFNEVESGVYEAPRPGEGILFIQNAGAAGPPSRTAAEVTGEWSIVRRAGKPICGLTLSDTAAGEDFAVRVRPPCDAFVTRFAPATWQVERGEIVLKAAKGNPWRFEEQDANTWQRVPATADPVLLVRK